ncbi:MAG: carboxypeptidase-like regulatory domain-containing protein [Armatimonadetes bacterium]|nr:carboxypeptidase-like regulatory domain-containing protein [Armatimonadota bacterium]
MRSLIAICFAMLLSWYISQSLSIAGEISGTVFDTDGQTPKANATVFLSSSDETLRARFNLPRATTSNNDGRFKFEGLVAGAYTVRALHEADSTVATSQTRLPNDGARVGVWLTLRQMRSQDGSMIWGVVKSDGGEVRVDAQVLYRKVGENDWQRAQVDEFGMYFVRGLDAGEYEVAAISGRMARVPEPLKRLLTTSLKPQRVTLQGNAVLRVDLTAVELMRPALEGVKGLMRGALKLQVSGQLVDEDGKPLARMPFRVTDMRAQFRGKGGNQFAMAMTFDLRSETDENGGFSVTVGDLGMRKETLRIAGALAAGGEITLTFEVEGFTPIVVKLPNEVVEQILKREVDELKADVGRVVVTRGITLKVRVVDAETGIPVAGAKVLVSLNELNPKIAELQMRLFERAEKRVGKAVEKKMAAMRWQFFSVAGEDGCAIFEAMPLTTLYIYVAADGYEAAQRQITPAEKGRAVEITVELKQQLEQKRNQTKRHATEV